MSASPIRKPSPIKLCICKICKNPFPCTDPTANDCGNHGVPRKGTATNDHESL